MSCTCRLARSVWLVSENLAEVSVSHASRINCFTVRNKCRRIRFHEIFALLSAAIWAKIFKCHLGISINVLVVVIVKFFKKLGLVAEKTADCVCPLVVVRVVEALFSVLPVFGAPC